MYVRYADDFVVLILGNRKDALGIRDKINTFLKENLGLDLNLEKTIVSPNSAGFQSLGALCRKRDNSSIFNKSKNQLKVNITRRGFSRRLVPVSKSGFTSDSMNRSSLCKTIFARTGDITLPCGVPIVLFIRIFFSFITPTFNALSIRVRVLTQEIRSLRQSIITLWGMASKHLLISPWITHGKALPRRYSWFSAVWVDLLGLNPCDASRKCSSYTAVSNNCIAF